MLVTGFKICSWLSLTILAEILSIPVASFMPNLLIHLFTKLMSKGWKENNSTWLLSLLFSQSLTKQGCLVFTSTQSVPIFFLHHWQTSCWRYYILEFDQNQDTRPVFTQYNIFSWHLYLCLLKMVLYSTKNPPAHRSMKYWLTDWRLIFTA